MSCVRRLGLGLIVILVTTTGASASVVEAHLDRNHIALGESVELTLRLVGGSGAAAEEPPDLMPLVNDFEILDLAQSFRTQIINGRRDSSVNWHVTLAPRHKGEITLPSLRMGNAESQPLALRVGPEPAPASTAPGSAAGPAVFVEAVVDESAPYVQGKVSLTVRLHADASVTTGGLSEPVADGAIIERVGEDISYQAERDGKPYAVIERRFAIFPQRSGPLEISPVVFEGEVREPRANTRRDPFGGFFGSSGFEGFFADSPFQAPGGLMGRLFESPGRAVHARSEPIPLAVQPKPAEATGEWWIPAKSLELVERWETDPPVFRVGEPVNRLVAIRARGISVSQLPELELPQAEGFKQYTEPALEDTLHAGDEVVAVKAHPTALIPTRAGEITLPAIELSWWDTEANLARTASIPGRTVEVEATASIAGPPMASATPKVEPGTTGKAPSAPAPTFASTPTQNAPLIVLALALALSGGLGLWLARRRNQADPVQTARPAPAGARGPRLARAERSLRGACRAGDPESAASALSRIGHIRWPEAPPLNPGAWARRVGGSEIAQAVDTLQRVRYSPRSGEWNGGELWRAYTRARPRRARKHSGSNRGLPGLYPQRKEAATRA